MKRNQFIKSAVALLGVGGVNAANIGQDTNKWRIEELDEKALYNLEYSGEEIVNRKKGMRVLMHALNKELLRRTVKGETSVISCYVPNGDQENKYAECLTDLLISDPAKNVQFFAIDDRRAELILKPYNSQSQPFLFEKIAPNTYKKIQK